MKVRAVTRDLLDLLLRMGRESHPLEFAGVLIAEDGVVSEIYLLPGTVSRGDSASVLLDMMPLDSRMAGSAHSHPNGVIHPSGADLSFFPRTGRCHIIVGYPYGRDDWGAFRTDGQPLDLEVV